MEDGYFLALKSLVLRVPSSSSKKTKTVTAPFLSEIKISQRLAITMNIST